MGAFEIMVVSMTVVIGGFLVLFTVTPMGRAITDRIRGRTDPMLRDEMLGEIQALRAEIAELAERVDFHERLLARDRSALPGRDD